MSRSVRFPNTGLRAVALAATLGGQTACIKAVPVASVPNVAAFSPVSTLARTPGTLDGAMPPRIVVRDYWGSPRASVVAWSDDENWQGLRTAVLRDGTVAYDHTVYLSAYSVPNLAMLRGAQWYAFSDAAVGGHQLVLQGASADQFNCVGKQGCSPFVALRARVPDELLRSTHDSLVVKVVSPDGFETTIALRGDLIASYLMKVDSVSAARKARSKSSNR